MLAVIAAGGGMVAFHLAPTVYAKPVDFQVWGFGFRVQGSGFRVQGLGFRV